MRISRISRLLRISRETNEDIEDEDIEVFEDTSQKIITDPKELLEHPGK